MIGPVIIITIGTIAGWLLAVINAMRTRNTGEDDSGAV